MLPIYLRTLLVICAVLALFAVCNRVKKSKMLVEDSIFWVVCAFVLVLLAIFPDIAVHLAYAIGFMSAANFVYLVIIALLIWKIFTNSLEISRLKNKINELAQEVALMHVNEAGPNESEAAPSETTPDSNQSKVGSDQSPKNKPE